MSHWVVAEEAGDLLGYAYYGPFRARSGYRYTVEDSVYVRPDAAGRGIGSRLLGALVEHATGGRPAGDDRRRRQLGQPGLDPAARAARLVRAEVLTGVG